MQNMTVRFFVVSFDNEDEIEPITLVEVDEYDFLNAEGDITYERHTVFENGCSQICLTKGL